MHNGVCLLSKLQSSVWGRESIPIQSNWNLNLNASTSLAVTFRFNCKWITLLQLDLNLQINNLTACTSTISSNTVNLMSRHRMAYIRFPFLSFLCLHAVVPGGGAVSKSSIYSVRITPTWRRKQPLQSWTEEGTSMMMRDAHSSSRLGFS